MSAAPSADFVSALNDHQPRLRRLARTYCPHDAADRQDLYQDIVLQLWRAWPRYEARPDVQLGTWLYRVALNVAISDLRRRTRRPTADRLPGPEGSPEVAVPPPEGPDPDDLAQLYRAIARLSDVEKAFVLLYLEEKTYAEMADILGITPNNVRVKMHRVQDKLRQLLTQPA